VRVSYAEAEEAEEAEEAAFGRSAAAEEAVGK
jgi:hypothetical protein